MAIDNAVCQRNELTSTQAATKSRGRLRECVLPYWMPLDAVSRT